MVEHARGRVRLPPPLAGARHLAHLARLRRRPRSRGRAHGHPRRGRQLDRPGHRRQHRRGRRPLVRRHRGGLGALFGTAGAAVLVLDPGDRRRPTPGAAGSGGSSPGSSRPSPGLHLQVPRVGGPLLRPRPAGLPVRRLRHRLVAPRGADRRPAGLLSWASARHRPPAGTHRRPAGAGSVVGGSAWPRLASISTLMLFSGHEGVDTLITDYGQDSVRPCRSSPSAKLVRRAAPQRARGRAGGSSR